MIVIFLPVSDDLIGINEVATVMVSNPYDSWAYVYTNMETTTPVSKNLDILVIKFICSAKFAKKFHHQYRAFICDFSAK